MSRMAQETSRLVGELRLIAARSDRLAEKTKKERRTQMHGDEDGRSEFGLDVEPEGSGGAPEVAGAPESENGTATPPDAARDEGVTDMAKKTATRGPRATTKKTTTRKVAAKAAKTPKPKAAAVAKEPKTPRAPRGNGKRRARLCIADPETQSLIKRLLKSATLDAKEQAMADAVVRRIDYLSKA